MRGSLESRRLRVRSRPCQLQLNVLERCLPGASGMPPPRFSQGTMPPPRYSQGTKDILDGLMSDSKLNPVRQRELRQVMEHGCAAGRPKPVRPVFNRRDVPYEDPLRGIALNPNLIRHAGIRTQPQIAAAHGDYRRPQFAGGGRRVDRDGEKLRLQNINAYGSELGAAQPAASAEPPPKLRSGPAELHAQISTEIEERQAFVQQMRAAGNTEHEATIQQQICERMEELRLVEKHMHGSNSRAS